MIGDVQVRNRGTLAGSIAHADPASDLPAILLALEGTLVIRSGSGERVVAVDGFFQGAFATDLGEDEILTEIRLPATPDGAGMAYRAIEQPASGYSMVGVAAVVGRAGDSIGYARIAITGVGDVAYRATAVEAALLGSDGGAAAIEAAAAHATDGQVVARTSTRTPSTGPRWPRSIPAGRSKRHSPRSTDPRGPERILGPARACGSRDSARENARTPAWSERS